MPGAGKESVEGKTRKIEETKNQFMRITNNALENCNNLELQLVSSLLCATKSTAAEKEKKKKEQKEKKEQKKEDEMNSFHLLTAPCCSSRVEYLSLCAARFVFDQPFRKVAY